MATVPDVVTYYDYPDSRSIKTYSEWGSSLFDVMEFLMRPPTLHLQMTSAVTFVNSTYSTISFNKVITDTHGFWNPALPTRITPTVPGWYKGWVGTSFAINQGTTGRRIPSLFVMPSGDSVARRDHRGVSLTAQDQMLKGLRFFTPANGTTNYFEFKTYQNSGSNMVSVSSASCPAKWPEIFMRWYKPL